LLDLCNQDVNSSYIKDISNIVNTCVGALINVFPIDTFVVQCTVRF